MNVGIFTNILLDGGYYLTNITWGGEGGDTFTNRSDEEKNKTIIKFSNRSKGKNNAMYGISPKNRMDDETYNNWKRKISESSKGEKSYWYGKHHSEETKRKMSENHADFSGEKSYWYGKHLSEETKQKIREGNLGKKLSTQTKKKISESIKGDKNPMHGKKMYDVFVKKYGKDADKKYQEMIDKRSKTLREKNKKLKELT